MGVALRTLLVTGCRGFIGDAVARRAVGRGVTVVGVARSASNDMPFPVIPADLTEEDCVGVLDEYQVDAIFHAAGAASVGDSLNHPVADLRASLGTLSPMLDAARRARNKPRVVFPSSAAVYGSVEGSIAETRQPAPVSPYGFHKLACELLMREYRECFGVESTVARIFSTYGPQQRRLLLWEVYEQARLGGEVILRGTGDEERDYLHVDDLSDSVLDLLTLEALPPVVNLATGRSITTRSLSQIVLDALGNPCGIRCLGQTPSGDPQRWRADVSLLRRLCARSSRDVDEGVRQCIAAWETNR